MDRFNEEIYGKVLWECYRSNVYIVTLSLMYVLLGAAAVIWAMDKDQFLFYVLAVVVIFFCLWRINRVHHPVALICEKKLLVAVPWSFFTFDYYITFRALYMPVAYKDVAGVSSRWNHLYIGGREEGGLVSLPVQLAYVSRDGKYDFQNWVESKQRE
uniref:hypothetical protein n=1 Tax=Dialister sp. TaxID=1955814 RepID=UPI004025C64A